MRFGDVEIPRGWVIAGVVVILLVIFVGIPLGVYTGNRNEGTSRELGLTREFKNMQSRYGQFRLGYADSLGIIDAKKNAMNDVLHAAVTGRYDKSGKAGEVDRQAFFSAVKEAYPDLSGLDVYDKLLTFVQAGRERFAKDQEMLADMVRSYDTWRKTGSFLHPTIVGWCGFPSDSIEVRIGSKVLRGKEALDKMSQVEIGAEAAEIFDTGVDKTLSTK
ncbi:MAG: hypothetical protein K2W82_16130 [Candidatus Obscuribacterales bacterium]|nr:hypothetical protein [Candidatus Obscuribacterales bacterium]